jgi:serine/tyrosine/threonine adenylyltransferase
MPHRGGSSTRSLASSVEIPDLDHLPFVNRFTRDLPADPSDLAQRRQVHGAAFSRVRPTPVSAPSTLAWSPEVAELLGISEDVCHTQDFAEVFSGNRVPTGADPFAMAYAGHQFGNWAGQLGDGRAIALGEVCDMRGGFQTLQLKGAGPTPYSRTADGRAVLRSSLREFLCSEAMHHLGIPTTRALSLVLTGDQVVRDVLYDGHPAPERGAVVCRVAPSFTRFGNVELPASRDDVDLLRRTVEVTMSNDFGLDGPRDIAAWFHEIGQRTARLVADWMRVGFVHGVLNTDNCSILGLTIDYGPYGWLESFDPGWTPNTTDAGTRRYRFGNQPAVMAWNLAQLGSALVSLVGDPAPLQEGLEEYGRTYHREFASTMHRRLGLRDDDPDLVQELFSVLVSTEIDYPIFMRNLCSVSGDATCGEDDLLAPLAAAFYAPDEVAGDVRAGLVSWLRRWQARAGDRAEMDRLNPRFVLRNWMAQEAIDAADAGDASVTVELLDVLRRPYEEQPGRERWASRRPEWARTRVGCSMLSCSS